MIKISSKFKIRGGKQLSGEVNLSGAKNSATKLLIASLLTDKPVHLYNIPTGIIELKITKEICETLGMSFKRFDNEEVFIQTRKIKTNSFSQTLGIVNRIGILAAGPLINRTGEAKIPRLGGDKIGSRPIDFHLNALKQLGAIVKEYKNFVHIKAKRLIGSNIILPYPSVGATENIIMSACMAEGTTTITNAAIEPEIIDLILFLQKLGAIIDVCTDRKIIIQGVKKLGPAEHRVMPDRLEAASFACAAIASKGEVFIHDARQIDMISFLNAIRLIGAEYEIKDNGIRFFYKNELKPIVIETNVHPGFMTDWQPPFTILMTQANGISIIHETVYENRFGYINELIKMGAEIDLNYACLGTSLCRFHNSNYKHSAVIKGPVKLSPASINVPDIRAGFSYMVAAILANGESLINGAYYIDRGYEDIETKLKNLGVDIERVQ